MGVNLVEVDLINSTKRRGDDAGMMGTVVKQVELPDRRGER